MTTLQFTTPVEGQTFKPAEVSQLIFSIQKPIYLQLYSVSVSMTSATGEQVWSAQADVTQTGATATCGWPETPGNYTVEGVLYNMFGTPLARIQRQFTVTPK